MVRKSIIGMILTAGLVTGAIGCGANKDTVGTDAIKLDVKPSKRMVYTGETVTFFTKSENTLGKDAQLKWKTTGGKLTTEQEGRVARVTFDQAGTFTVTGTITADGKEVSRQSNDIEVTAIPK